MSEVFWRLKVTAGRIKGFSGDLRLALKITSSGTDRWTGGLPSPVGSFKAGCFDV